LLYDLIVVGAGPAGAVLAYELARQGCQVLVLEKETLPWGKPCGGGLPLKTVRALPFDASSVLEREVEGEIVSFRGRELLRARVERPFAWLVMRDRFDHFLAQKAAAAGARLLDETAVAAVEEADGRVTALTPRGRFQARWLAGADGANSTVTRSVGLLRQQPRGVAIEAELEVPAAALELQGGYATFDFGAVPYGYGWVFPKQNHLSAGVFHARAGKAPGLRGWLETFIQAQPSLRNYIRLHLRGHRISLGGARQTLHRGHTLLVGDAAHLADPWLGEGIYYAIRSAGLAAEALMQALAEGGPGLSLYTRNVHAQIGLELAAARRLALFVYRSPGLCSRLMSRSVQMQRDVCATIRGDLTFRQLNRSLLLHLPVILRQALNG